MSRIYTEIRISHKSEKDKKDFEEKFDVQLAAKCYSNRSAFIKEKINNLGEEDLNEPVR